MRLCAKKCQHAEFQLAGSQAGHTSWMSVEVKDAGRLFQFKVGRVISLKFN